MANVIVYNPSDIIVANRVIKYLKSVNTPEYEGSNTLINPDLSSLSEVPQKYWKVNTGIVIEMNQTEKDAINIALRRPNMIAVSEDKEEYTTTGTEFVEIYSSTSFLAADSYVVKWFGEVTNSSSNRKTSWEFRINDSLVMAKGTYKPSGADDFEPVGAGFIYENPTLSDVKFSVYLKTSNSNSTAKIRRNLITLRKEGT